MKMRLGESYIIIWQLARFGKTAMHLLTHNTNALLRRTCWMEQRKDEIVDAVCSSAIGDFVQL